MFSVKSCIKCSSIGLVVLLIAGQSGAASSVDVLRNFLTGFKSTPKMTKAQMSSLDKIEEQVKLEQCARDEFQVFDLENTLVQPWKESWKKRDLKAFDSLVQGNTAGRTLALFPTLTSPHRKFNGIEHYKWTTTAQQQTVADRLNEYGQVSDVELDIIDYTVAMDQRNESLRFDNAEVLLKFSVTGFDKKGLRRSDRGQLRGLASKVNSQWKLSKVVSIDGETLLSGRAPAYVDVTANTKMGSLPVYLRTEAIRRGGYALAVADMNGDGVNDMLIGMRDQLKLLAGSASGAFTDVTKGSGLEGMKYVKTAIFADFENRGVQDLVVTLLKPENFVLYSGHTSVVALRGDGRGHFKNKDINFGSKRRFLQPMPAAVGDFNNDGFLDLYVGYPGTRDFTSFSKADDVKSDVQGVYLNDGKGGFKDFRDLYQLSDNNNPFKLFPHSSMAVNFDQAGGIDLLVADDRNNLSPVYVNDGQANFKQVAKEIGIGNNGFGMSMAASDYNNDGITDIAWTNVNFHAARRMFTACQRHFKTATFYNEEGLRLFEGVRGGKFKESTLSANLLAAAGQGAAGVSFIDYDNDGFMDIYLVNGLWSGSKEGQDIAGVFIPMAQSYGYSMQHNLKHDNRMSFKNVLAEMSGRIDINTFSISKAKSQHPSLAGYQHNRLFRNNGDSTFTEIGFFEGVDSISDGYVVGSVMNKNGLPDLVLRNGDPGSKDYKFPVVQYFKNNLVNDNKSVILTLEGKKLNRDAVGAFAIAQFGKHSQVQHLVANSGSVQSERAITFSLGEKDSVPSIEIHWPSGKVQMLKNVQSGRHHIVEDSPIQVSKK